MFDEDGKLLYIGKTTYLYGRMNAHFSKDAISKQPWKLDVDKIEVMELNNQYDIDIVEIYLIGKEKPKYNIVLSINNCEPTINIKYKIKRKFTICSPIKDDVLEYYNISDDIKYKICKNLKIYTKTHLNEEYEKNNTISRKWLENNNDYAERVKQDTRNFFMNKVQTRSNESRWTTYTDLKNKLKCKGYSKGFINQDESLFLFNNCKAYAYLRNDFPSDLQRENKDNIDLDFYAINYLVKVIKYVTVDLNKEFFVFIPSKRIFNILKNWLGKDKICLFK